MEYKYNRLINIRLKMSKIILIELEGLIRKVYLKYSTIFNRQSASTGNMKGFQNTGNISISFLQATTYSMIVNTDNVESSRSSMFNPNKLNVTHKY